MEDSVLGGWLATDYLLELGHRRIAYVSDTLEDVFSSTAASLRRYQGYTRALEAAGIAVQPEYLKHGRHSREEARRCAAELLALDDRPTAIFAASDTQAIGVLEAAHDTGLRVPEDLSLVGYDDLEVAGYLGLTTVRQSLFESGQRGAQILLQAIDGQVPDAPHVDMPVELIVRDSCRAVNTPAPTSEEVMAVPR
jgi:LacI family transcriptional regulator/LacI family repressor for deo operon, udp, cdd, tsx, nupC, and nupG